MKQYYFLFTLLTGVFLSLAAQERCATYQVLLQQLKDNPSFAQKFRETEKNYANYSRQTGDQKKGKPAALTIPVIVHVLYNTPQQNISDAQVQSQIDVLNEDFTATNKDYKNYDAGYGDVKGDADIKFCLVQIVRKATTFRSFPVNDGMKFTRRGGSDAITPMNTLNIWVCNLGQNVLGYAQFPGGSPETFGVVCHYRAFGRGAQYDFYSNYDLGRTMTHEIGHCLGLRHIWGDANCGNDFVDDTPLHNTYNFGCPGEGHLSTCTGNPLEMWMNYMDYTDDRCMYFLSDGQVSRAGYFIDNDLQLQSIINSACVLGGNSPLTRSGNTEITPRRINQFLLYPSISKGRVNLEVNSDIPGIKQIQIYNLAGVLVEQLQMVLSPGMNTKEIDLSHLVNGLYLVQIGNGLKDPVQKLVIQQ